MWIKQCHKPSPKSLEIGGMVTIPKWVVYDIVLPTLLLMDKVMHQLIGALSHYYPLIYRVSQLPIVTNWCSIVSIHSITGLYYAD